MLVVQVFHVLDDLETFKQRVEEIDEQVLVGLCPEDALEAEIGQQADVSFLCVSHVLIYKMCAYAMAKVHCFRHTSKSRAQSQFLLRCSILWKLFPGDITKKEKLMNINYRRARTHSRLPPLVFNVRESHRNVRLCTRTKIRQPQCA